MFILLLTDMKQFNLLLNQFSYKNYLLLTPADISKL